MCNKRAIINTSRLFLRPLTQNDCSAQYVEWLKDPLVNQYLETRWHEQNEQAVLEFIQQAEQDSSVFLYAIIVGGIGVHIGNIKLGPVNFNHGFADVSYFIGNREFWGNGFATEAIIGITQFAFLNLNLSRVQAGVYSSNIGSAKALEKAGFVLEGVQKGKFAIGDTREDHLLFGVLREQWGVKA